MTSDDWDNVEKRLLAYRLQRSEGRWLETILKMYDLVRELRSSSILDNARAGLSLLTLILGDGEKSGGFDVIWHEDVRQYALYRSVSVTEDPELINKFDKSKIVSAIESAWTNWTERDEQQN